VVSADQEEEAAFLAPAAIPDVRFSTNSVAYIGQEE
jgi:hypothetical protein